MNEMEALVDKLYNEHHLEKDEYVALIENRESVRDYLFELSRSVREKYYGKEVYIRGLIEFSSYCKTIAITAVYAAAISKLNATD